MKKLIKSSAMIIWACCFGFGFSILAADTAFAGKAKDVRFVVAVLPEGGPEIAAEPMALNMYLGALDYRIRTFHELKGKYKLKWNHTLFADSDECLTAVASEQPR